MKNILIYFILFLSAVSLSQTAGVKPPYVVNSAGHKDTLVGSMRHSFNIGEPIIGTVPNPHTPGTPYYTQGFLQPDYRIGTAFNVHISSANESCLDAKDGLILVNAYNNKGRVKYTLTPSPSAGDTTSVISGLSPGTYTLSVRDSIGRVLTHTITIVASSETCPITVYHAFSPNHDGLNDLYIISGIENYPDNHVYFFNRWGTLVWDKAKYDNVKNVWDGRDNNGLTLNVGTYFYVIEISGQKPRKNWVELTR